MLLFLRLFFFFNRSTYSLVCFVCCIFQTCKETQEISALTKAADFVKAFILGFQVEVSAQVLLFKVSSRCKKCHVMNNLSIDWLEVSR